MVRCQVLKESQTLFTVREAVTNFMRGGCLHFACFCLNIPTPPKNGQVGLDPPKNVNIGLDPP